MKILSRLKDWYLRQSSWIGWLGIGLIAATFVLKEVLPERFKSRDEDINRAIAIIDSDEEEVRQTLDKSHYELGARIYSEDSSNYTAQEMTRIAKLSAEGGFYMARIDRLSKSDEVAHSNFIGKDGPSIEEMKHKISLMSKFANDWEKEEFESAGRRNSRGKKSSDAWQIKMEYDFTQHMKAFSNEFNLAHDLDDWEKKQRGLLENEEKATRRRAAVWSIVLYVVFATGWIITVADKAVGKASGGPGTE
jgi:hypothetical protein